MQGLFLIKNGTSENWQKTLGAFVAWGSATVTYKNGQYTMIFTLNVKDRYNFNRGMSDIATGISDDVNGRFAVLGWAKSFMTYGELVRMVKWNEGGINSVSIENVEECEK